MKYNVLCQLRDIYNAIRLFEEEFSKRYNLSLNEAMLLCTLSHERNPVCKDLSEKLALTPSNLSKIIKSAEDKKLINRMLMAKDKRQMCFSLSEKGKEKLSEMKTAENEIENLLSRIKK
jgi:DNA-binding MarR family transcriptional regulator